MAKRLGIIGGGQLGMMITEAAKNLSDAVSEITVLDPTDNCPAAQAGAKQIVGDFKDELAILKLAEQSDIITYEIESGNTDVLSKLKAKIEPSPSTLGIIQDKFSQKTFLSENELPVSQFYFQQAFTNTVQEKWSKISESYGKMILGYFGKTPTAPDPEIVKIASKQLSLKPTKEDVHDLNDNNPNMGIDYNKKLLEDKNIESTDENIFISATCGAKGIAFLEGNGELGIRYKDNNIKESTNSNNKSSSDEITRVTVNGKDYEVIIHSN